jgi:uncharacterized protein (TIGR02996 family)
MTTDRSDLIALLAADLTDMENRLVLADALEEAGREDEAALCRDEQITLLVHEDTVYDADERTYTYHEEGGYSVPLDAGDMDEALEMAEDLAREGDWGEDGASVDVWVTEENAAGEEMDRQEITVEIEPDHSTLIRKATRHDEGRSCGDDPDDHDWTHQGEGGCDENPGVWSTGGTGMTFASHCRTCGLHRTEHHTGSQRNPGEHDTVEYEMPDRWCEDCQSDDCDCDSEDD